jgi:hypothetical protein
MQLCENQINKLRAGYYQKFGGEKNFPTNDENPLYKDLEKELLAYVQQIKNSCFSNCNKNCTSSEECRNEKNKITRYALTASRKQLSQLLHQPSPNVKTQHDSFYEGFVELCCRFIGIDWEDFKSQSKTTTELNLKSSKKSSIDDERTLDDTSGASPNHIIRNDTSNDEEIENPEKINTSNLNLWKFATILCIAVITIMLTVSNFNNKTRPPTIKNNANNTGLVDSALIKVFEGFHRATVNNDTNIEWSSTTEYWRNSFGRKIIKKEDFIKYYRMTKAYGTEYRYLSILPDADRDSIARFYVWFKFKDEAPYLLKRSFLMKSELPQLGKVSIADGISDEIYTEVKRYYYVPSTVSKIKIDSLVKTYSLKKIIENYNIVDLTAIDLNLIPIPASSAFPDKQQEIWNDVLMKVTMKLEKNSGNWQIHITEKVMITPQ